MSRLQERIEALRKGFAEKVATPLASWAERVQLREKLAKVLPQSLASRLPTTLNAQAVGAFLGQTLQAQGAAFYGKLATAVLSTWFLADVTALLIERFIPEAPPARVSPMARGDRSFKTVDDYAIIWTRNLFNSKGLIPGDEQGQPQDQGGQPVRTSLPFNLIGTLILRDELRSIATIEDKSASLVYPVRVDDEIPSKARILKVEADRVIFINTSTGRREYIDLPEEAINAPHLQVGQPQAAAGGAGVERIGNSFTVSRSEVDKALADFNRVLTEARAVPNFENGAAQGYKLFQIVPNSIYDKLGLKNGDVIMGINGEAINDPAKAFELLTQLKAGASNLDLSIKRDGRTQNYNYNIR